VAERKNGRVILRLSNKSALEEIDADEKTGFVFKHRHSWPAEKGTNLVFLQFGPVIDGTGRILPVLNMEVFFKNGLVDKVFAHHVIKADMDAPLTKGDFAVSVPAGTKVFDFRGDRTKPKFRPTRDPVPDVLAFATAITDENRGILPRLNYGLPAPKLDAASWLTNEGKTRKPNLEGKAILVYFCGARSGPCLYELPDVQGAAKELGEKGVLLIGMHDSSANLAEVVEFARKNGLTYQLAIDRPAEKGPSLGTTFQAFGVQGMPNAALVDGKGRLVFVGRFKEARQKALELPKTENP
jgi:peroxiredoxin